MARAAAIASVPAFALGACSGAGRDVVVHEPPTGGPDAGASAAADGANGASGASGGASTDAGAKEAYEHVARRPHVVLALAEARGVSADDARTLTESLAAAFDRCAEGELERGALVDGAARLVVVGGRDGGVAAHKLVVAPGAENAATALVCLVAPARSLPLPRASAEALARGRSDVGLAFEASWSARRADP